MPKDKQKKLDARSNNSIFLGYGDTVKGFRIFDETWNKVYQSRDVVFNERPVLQELHSTEPKQSEPSDDKHLSVNEMKEEEISDDESSSDPKGNYETRQSKREKKAPDRYGEWVHTAQVNSPTTYEEAMHDTDSEK